MHETIPRQRRGAPSRTTHRHGLQERHIWSTSYGAVRVLRRTVPASSKVRLFACCLVIAVLYRLTLTTFNRADPCANRRSTMSSNSTTIGVGFGTAAMRGRRCTEAVTMALDAGFRKFDTAEENEYWYDQSAVGVALRSFFAKELDTSDREDGTSCSFTCGDEDLQISTKIPPWELTSVSNIRRRAASSREELVGFCEEIEAKSKDGKAVETRPYPLDVYYIHAPECWDGWHTRCKDFGKTLSLRDVWLALEAVVGIDGSARRIGLSNVYSSQLLDIIHFVKKRQRAIENGEGDEYVYPPPRMPDVLQSYADPLKPEKELRRICKKHGIEFVSYSTLGTQHQMKDGRNPVLGNSVIISLAEKYDRSVAEVVLSWAIQKGMSVIPRSTNEVHIRELANMLTNPPFLEVHDLGSVDELGLN